MDDFQWKDFQKFTLVVKKYLNYISSPYIVYMLYVTTTVDFNRQSSDYMYTYEGVLSKRAACFYAWIIMKFNFYYFDIITN